MSYTPTEWKTGDVITAEKLNNIESGIVNAGGGSGDAFIVNAEVELSVTTGETISAEVDKTALQIVEAIKNLKQVIIELSVSRYDTNNNTEVGRNKLQIASINCSVDPNTGVPSWVRGDVLQISNGKIASHWIKIDGNDNVTSGYDLLQVQS